MSDISLIVDHNPSDENNSFLRKQIVEFNAQFLHERASQFSIFARNSKNEIIGGATIWEQSDALYIDILWIEENYRNQGMGSQLICTLIKEAGLRNIKKIFVDTYDFQAVDFIIKQGFFVIGRLDKFLLGHDRIYLKKDIKIA